MNRLKRLIPFLLASAVLLPASPASAQKQKAPPLAAGPKALGKFEDWTAAIHEEGGQAVCYAFTYASNSTPAMQGRPKPVLTVTQRPTGRDAVAISAGFPYAAGAEVTVQIEQAALNFYTSGRSAFARDGATTVSALQKARQIVARSPSPRGQVIDTFSTRGFFQAYQAINKACPR